MAYTFSVNNAPVTGAVAMWTLINTLMTAGWLKKMDSDGTSYSSTGVQVTGGASGTHGLGNNHAWVRLQSPITNGGSVINQTRELIFQRGAAGNDSDWRIKYSASALFTGGSPGAAQVPSATDEVILLGGASDSSPTYTTTWLPVNNTYRWHIACGGAAEFYSFVAWSEPVGAVSTTITAIALDIMTPGSYSASDVDPAVMYCSTATAANAGLSELIAATFPTSNTAPPSKARAWLGATSSAGILTAGTNNVNVGMITYGNNIIGTLNTLASNPWNSKDDLLPALWGNKGTVPPLGVKGFSTLFMIGSIVRTNMVVCDFASTGAGDKIYVGKLWLPWSGALPLI